jgi:hypothetical protein
MTIQMATFSNGDTNYVAALNGNFATLAALLDAVNNIIAGQITASQGPGAAYAALFGETVAVIGVGSYATSGSGSNLTVAGGFVWKPTMLTVVRSLSGATIDFTGQPAATYYVTVDGTGAPSRNTDATEALYSVVWDGAAFGTITRLAAVAWGAADDIAAQVSTALSATYTTLDARLEAGEAATVAAAALAAAAGTVSSVAATVPAFLSVAGSPITTSGTLAISYSGTALPIANGGTGGTTQSGARTALGLGTAATLDSDTDSTLAANSDAKIATQKAVKMYIDAAVTGGASDVMVFMGVIDCSANPNYPAADAGHLYKISVAGKIGGASGAVVEAGDTIYCITDASAGGTQASVGADWDIAQVNIDGAVIGPASATSGHLAVFSGTSGKIIADGGAAPTGTNTGDQTITLTGDVTGSGTGSFAATIANDAVTYAKIQNVSATDKLLGRSSSGAGDVEEITCTAFARSILDDADAATVRATIGAGTSSSSGTVTTVSVTTANGVSGSVATDTTTPAITLTLGAITPSSVNSVVLSGSSTPTLAVTGTTTVSGTNTGDQTTVSGNAGTATALATSRNIDGQAFNGTADITVIAPGTHAATGKTTPVDADEMPLVDSAASNVLKKLTWANLKATLKTYLDTLYQALNSNLTTIAGLTATTDSFIQAKSSAWASRTVAQVSADLQGTGLITDAVGFRTIPQNSQSTAYTTVAADAGKHILHPSADVTARTITIDSNANVAYPIGTAITFVNQASAGVMTIAITSDTMRLAVAGSTGSRTLAANGVATALKITSTEWIISGSGLT